MKMVLGTTLAVLLSCATVSNAQTNPPAGDAAVVLLTNELERIAKDSEGVVGVAAWRLDGEGPVIGMALDEPFPMASTFKVAVAGKIFADVDAGRLRLDQMILLEEDMRVPSPIIADHLIHPGVSLSLLNWLELMLTVSDNTATDVMVKIAGGAPAVTAWLQENNITDVRVDEDTAASLQRFLKLPRGPFNAVYKAAVDAGQVPDGSHTPHPHYYNAPQNTATPRGMATLLTGLFSGKFLSSESTEILTGIMERTTTGVARIRGRMPAGTVVADKTGTLGGSVNDVGVVTLPDDAGQIVIVAFIKKGPLGEEGGEPVIADMSRSIRDYFLFNSPFLDR
jgi:beta-lactamase class A|tara:strand:- start:123157 stop:124170 length:1014 start_codon:yes stop_codon:yes gene_type:complete